MATFRQLAARVDWVVMAGDRNRVTLVFSAAGVPVDVSGSWTATADDGSTLDVDGTDAATGTLVVSGAVSASARRWQLDWTNTAGATLTLASGRVTAREWLPV